MDSERLDSPKEVRGSWAERRFLRAGDETLPGAKIGELEMELGAALEGGQIEILFQPQYSCPESALIGAEALARWRHPRHGTIGGDSLFAIAGRAGCDIDLSRHVMRRALAHAKQWNGDLRLSINVTAGDIEAEDFVENIGRALSESGFRADRLTLEITEQALVNDVERSARRLQRMADVGIRIALDDFGAGFCNFRYLKLLPLHALKLDRTMVAGIVDDARDLAVLRGIVALAHTLDLTVIAEGIETEEQRLAVTREGCEVWQGFLGSRPMQAEDFGGL